jgi:hypothetical protein
VSIVPLRRASVESRVGDWQPRLSAEPVKAGPVGPGAGPLLTEYALSSVLKRTPQEVMKQAANLWREVAWIRAAERVISGTVAGSPIPGASANEGKVGWHLEDPDGETIDDDYEGEPRAKEAYELLCHPQAKTDAPQKLTRRELWNLTSRHMGICGPAFWYKDQQDSYGIPASYLYIRPDRLYPIPDDTGNLAYWLLDADKKGKTPQRFEVTDLVQFNLELPDDGFFGVGLVVSAINKIQFGQALDRHVTSVVASGGRLSGIIAPKAGVIDNDNIYQQLVRDWRNIAEQPEAAKRAQVVRYPVEFTKTVADLQQLEVVKLLSNNRDELLELWGVPLSQIGGSPAAGLNSGDVRKFDRAALIQNAVEPRCDVMAERIQIEMDDWQPYLGWAPKFSFDVPQLEDDSPRYDKVQKSLGVPMKGSERRELLGLDPLGPEIKDANGRVIDDIILVNNTLVDLSEMGSVAQAPVSPLPPASPGTAIAGTPMPMEAQPTPPKAPKPPSTQPSKAKLSQPEFVKIVTVELAHQYPAKVLGWIKQVDWTFDDKVKVKKIEATKDPATLAPKVVTAIESGLEAGADINPVILVCLPSRAKCLIANGNHRVEALQEQGIKKVQAYIGTATAANEQAVLDGITAMQAPEFDDKGVPKKANLRGAMRAFRASVETHALPKMRASASRVLEEQRRSVLGEVRLRSQHIMGHPEDSSAWWKPERWNATLLAALSGTYQSIGAQVVAQVNAHKADLGVSFGPAVPVPPRVIARILDKAAKRVVGINDWTRDQLVTLIGQGARDGLSPAELGDAIEKWTGWNEYRAERIATTELAQAYNDATLGSYREAGIDMVEADDACTCDECQEAFGDHPVMPMDEADGIEDHPNGTLEWLPVITEDAALGDLEAES